MKHIALPIIVAFVISEFCACGDVPRGDFNTDVSTSSPAWTTAGTTSAEPEITAAETETADETTNGNAETSADIPEITSVEVESTAPEPDTADTDSESGWRFDDFHSAVTDKRTEKISEVLDSQSSAPEKDDDALTFMFALRDDVDEYNYLYFGVGLKEVRIPITEHELYVLMVNGVPIPEAVIIEDGVIWIPADELNGVSVPDQERVAFYNYIPYIPLDTPDLRMKYSIETVSMYKSDYLGYSLSAIMLESETSEPTYTVDEARDIVGSLVREMYMEALPLLDSDEENELNTILSDDSMERVRRDAESLTIKDLKPFGRYYCFNTSAVGAGIYFDRYTGRIFSDAPITQNFTLFIHGGLYSIGEAYW